MKRSRTGVRAVTRAEEADDRKVMTLVFGGILSRRFGRYVFGMNTREIGAARHVGEADP